MEVIFHSSIQLQLWEEAAMLEGLAGCHHLGASIAAEETTGSTGLLMGFQPRRTQSGAQIILSSVALSH